MTRIPRGAGGREPGGRVFDRDRRTRGEPEPSQREKVGLGLRLYRCHVLFADDRLEGFRQAGSVEDRLDVFAPGAGDDRQPSPPVQPFGSGPPRPG